MNVSSGPAAGFSKRQMSILTAIGGLIIATTATSLVLSNSNGLDELMDIGPGIQQPPSSTTVGRVIEPDPDYREALRSARIAIDSWETDFSRHTVTYTDILSGGPSRDDIPPLDDPKFTTFQDADQRLGGQAPVIDLELNGDTRAYPLQIMTWHEIVNDVIGGLPVAVTFCPLCNSAIVFDRRLNGTVYDFGTSGKLRNSDLIMWDRQTESWWQQFTGEGIVGELAGEQLTFLPASIISWSDFKTAYPEGQVLSTDTGFSRSYGVNPYAGYDRADSSPFLLRGDLGRAAAAQGEGGGSNPRRRGRGLPLHHFGKGASCQLCRR